MITSGVLRKSLLGLEDLIGRAVTETLIEKLQMKGISYALNCENITYNKGEIEKIFADSLGQEIAKLLLRHLCKQCEELR